MYCETIENGIGVFVVFEVKASVWVGFCSVTVYDSVFRSILGFDGDGPEGCVV